MLLQPGEVWRGQGEGVVGAEQRQNTGAVPVIHRRKRLICVLDRLSQGQKKLIVTVMLGLAKYGTFV
jgi:hypothetical protein